MKVNTPYTECLGRYGLFLFWHGVFFSGRYVLHQPIKKGYIMTFNHNTDQDQKA